MALASADQAVGRRARIIYWVVAGVVAAYVGRLYYLQVVSGEKYRESAQANSVKLRAIEAPRGLMWDRNGRLLVGNRRSHDLVLDRERGRDLPRVARWVSRVTGQPPAEVLAEIELHRKQPKFVPVVVAKDLAFSQVAYVEARREDVPELSIETHTLRQYPNGNLGAHVLGYVGEIDAKDLADDELSAYHRMGDLMGKAGIERAQDRLLTGTRGVRRVVVNHVGREISDTLETPPRRGADVHLSLDLDVQAAAEEALGGHRGACVVLDVRDGSVIAIASSPTYEPSAFVGGISHVRWRQYADDPMDPLRFRAIAGTYPPGSSWKPLVSLAALDAGVHSPSSRVTCLGEVNIGGRRRCWKKGGHGVVDMHGAFVNSCNVYYYTAARDLGLKPIETLGGLFGFGSVTGIDVPGERAGVLPGDAWKRRTEGERWYPGDTVNLGIGQGFLIVTPLQVATYAMGIANGGDVWTPHVFSHATDPESGEVVARAQRELLHRVPLEAADVAFIHRCMEDTVRFGTGRRAQVSGIRVGGKTGTAQPSSGDPPEGLPREQWPERYKDHAWFMGFAPIEAPEVAFAIVLEHSGKHGGEVAAPVAHEVLEAWFRDRVSQVSSQ